MFAYLHPDQVFDSDHFFELCGSHRRIGVLDHEGRLEITSARNQRVIGVEFFVDAIGLENLFDTQHFLDLVEQGQTVLEVERRVGAKRYLAMLFMFEHLLAELAAFFSILFEAHQVVAGNLLIHV